MPDPEHDPSPESLLPEAGTSEQALAAFLKALLSRAAEKSTDDPGKHPLILVNALKNLLSDRRSAPPRSVLAWAVNRVNVFPDGAPKTRERIPNRDMPGTLFIFDLEEAIESRDRKAMFQLARYWFLASPSPESLLNVFLQHLGSAGSSWPEFLYAAHRAADFCRSGDTLWKIITMIIRMNSATKRPRRRKVSTSTVPEEMVTVVLYDGNPEFITRIGGLLRLWELDNPRQTLIREALKPAIRMLEDDFIQNMPLYPVQHNAAMGTPDYLGLVQKMVANREFTDSQIDAAIRTLEALRFLIPRVNRNKLPPMNWILNQLKETP